MAAATFVFKLRIVDCARTDALVIGTRFSRNPHGLCNSHLAIRPGKPVCQRFTLVEVSRLVECTVCFVAYRPRLALEPGPACPDASDGGIVPRDGPQALDPCRCCA